MPIINIDIFSLIPLLLISLSHGKPQGTATGFLWHDSVHSEYFLITNYHVLSGKDPYSGEALTAEPDAIQVWMNGLKMGTWKRMTYPLYSKTNSKNWLEHPRGPEIDVVALPIAIPSGTTAYALNDQPLTDIEMRVAAQISIVGFPRGDSGSGKLAIWQTGYIASEPEINHEGFPAFLVDTPAQPGNSGSPVILRRYGGWQVRDRGYQQTGGGSATKFAGVFSAAFGDAQMRLVWKPEVIPEIIANADRGKLKHPTISPISD